MLAMLLIMLPGFAAAVRVGMVRQLGGTNFDSASAVARDAAGIDAEIVDTLTSQVPGIPGDTFIVKVRVRPGDVLGQDGVTINVNW
jgi:hypothetical protein